MVNFVPKMDSDWLGNVYELWDIDRTQNFLTRGLYVDISKCSVTVANFFFAQNHKFH